MRCDVINREFMIIKSQHAYKLTQRCSKEKSELKFLYDKEIVALFYVECVVFLLYN